MIPHQLQIKNFLSYGPETQTIDFAPFHLICLSGKNGHGKSALLDAITWAIWGQARKTSMQSKPDAGLLHLGQKHMMVILEFEVNGTFYRIRREFLNTASKAFATLDFGVKNTQGTLAILTDKTIKDTQEKIEKMIGITYESFTNSTFLRQGQSNEFSKKSPKERKEILAQILQLQQFENQKKIALNYAKKLQQDALIQQSIKERVIQELTSLATVHEQQTINNEKLENLITHQKILHAKQEVLQHEQKKLSAQQQQQALLIHQVESVKKEIEQVSQNLAKLTKILTFNNEQNTLQTLQNEEQYLIQEQKESEQLQHNRLLLKEQYLQSKELLHETLTQYQKEQHTTQLQIQEIQQALTYTKKEYEQNQNNYEKLHLILNEEMIVLQQLQELQIQFDKDKGEIEQLQKDVENNQYLHQQMEASLTHKQQHIEQIKQAIEKLQHNTMQSCDQCLQSIDHKQQLKISTHFTQNLHQTVQETETLNITLQTTKNQLKTHQHKLAALRKSHDLDLRKIIAIKEQCKDFDQKNKELKQQESALEKQKQLIIAQEKQLQSFKEMLKSTTNREHEKKITSLQESLKTIEIAGKQINEQLEKKSLLIKKLPDIQKKIQEIKQYADPTIVAMHQVEQHKQQEELTKSTKNLLIFEQELQAFNHIQQAELNFIEQEKHLKIGLQTWQAEYQESITARAMLEQQQKRQIALNAELQALEKACTNLQHESNDYLEIAKALGKDGIQALLIEQAIPEIEHETNQILARLTNNQTQIFIESLRDLKRGGSKETLDIKISDSFGLRDYELFSGGEAFRIDFALRIGISKLLARRAGTSLQTIFIDEGFGSQDEEGLQLIMDNIYKIQDDFAKIIVVSHLPEMKEQFPVQFVIEKKRSGSTVSVVHQG